MTGRRLGPVCGSTPTDNFVFKLCYQWTTLLLLVFSFIVTCRLMLGNTLSCTDTNGEFPTSYINDKCYDEGVFTRPAKLIINKDATSTLDPSYEDFRRYQGYYQWVNLVFLVQAFNFCLPYLLWRSYDKGYAHRLTAGVHKFFDEHERRDRELCYLAKYVLVTKGKHKSYAAVHVFFEACNYAIALAQTLWLVYFFDFTGVPSFLPYVLTTWAEFKSFYFPSDGVCELFKFGRSGDIARYTAKCTLPLNSLYMKLFLFLYAWYILLTVLCGLVLIYRLALLVPSFRTFMAKVSSPLAEKSVLSSVCSRLSYSDWFFLSTLQKSMADVDFAQLVDKIAVICQGKDPHVGDIARFTLYDDTTKDLDGSNATSPV